MCAEAELGHGDRAFQVYRRTAPAFIEDISDIHRTEPYVYSQMVAGKDAPSFGEAKNSWLTGTAAWSFLSISQAILGVKQHGVKSVTLNGRPLEGNLIPPQAAGTRNTVEVLMG